MDYYLDNENLGLNEKNKKLFTDASKVPASDENYDENVDTFKRYSDFMLEKDGIIEVIHEMGAFSLMLCNKEQQICNKKVNNINDVTNYKNRIIMIFANYQEQPGLLDPVLPILVPYIMKNSLILIETYLQQPALSSTNNQTDILSCLKCFFQIVYILCKVRGYPPVIKFFSSEVSIFENVINFLLSLNCEDNENWYLLYVLILWTTILSMVPFDIDTIDSQGTIIAKLIYYFKNTITLSGNLRDISSYALSKFLTRPDLISKGLLDEFVSYCMNILLDINQNGNIFVNLGLLTALCEIFKNGQAKDLAKYVNHIVTVLIPFQFPGHIKNSGVFRKCIAKLTQRVGIVLLKPKFQKWRYHIELKTLNFKHTPHQHESSADDQSSAADELTYEVDFSSLETIIDYLLSELNDKEYIVRWSSGKGIGRVCERLTKPMVDDIFSSMLNLFKDEDNEYSWHGACLCIAELCKRGMILPDKLKDLIPSLEKALTFEVSKGTFCSGSQVRDSACYIIWALARAYTSDIMKPYVEKIAGTLILTILFDKEVNCRRAASAAFQEHVGRQGFFPHGIEIITEADYFTLGNRANCYLNVSTFIAQYHEYYKPLCDYLSFNRLFHVEIAIRELAAETLALLTPFDPSYFCEYILPKLISLSLSPNLSVRHGCLIAVGYILVGLSGKWDYENKSRNIRKKVLESVTPTERKLLEDSEYRKQFEEKYNSIKYVNNMEKMDLQLIDNINSMIDNLDKKKYYRGKGAEIMRSGANCFIRLLSVAKLALQEKDFVYYSDILIDNIKQSNIDIQKDACASFKLLNDVYGKQFLESNLNLLVSMEKKLIDIVKSSVIDENVHITKGYTMLIPFFDCILLNRNYSEVLESLFVNSKMKKTNNNDAETRKAAMESLGWLSLKFIKENPSVISHDMEKIITCILDGLLDYEIDRKIGDVGAKVREASMKSLTMLFIDLKLSGSDIFIEFFNKFAVMYLNGLIKQLAEKMSKMRITAGNCIQKFFYELKDCDLSYIIPCYADLRSIFLDDIRFDDNNEVYNVDWLEPTYCYKKIIGILLYEDYNSKLFEGLVSSIGSITEDVQKYSLESLEWIIEQLPSDKQQCIINKIFQTMIDIFTFYAKDDRFIEPLYTTIGLLLSKNMFISSIFLDSISKIREFIVKENYESKNIHKLLSSIDIFYNLLFFEKEEKYSIFKRTLRSILICMTHRYPAVRKKAAEKLFLFLSGLDDFSVAEISPDEAETVTLIIAETDWTDSVDSIKAKRDTIAEMLKIIIEEKK